ncbi:MAG: PDZ domain-containing protein [Thermodesulfovibrionaceae bacterium]
MFRNKNYTKSLVLAILIFVIYFFSENVYCQDEEFAIFLKSKLKKIHDQFSPSILPINNALAVAIEKNYAIIPAAKVEKLSVVALDTKLNIAILKTEKAITPIRFDLPRKQIDVFFLVTDTSVMVVNGSWRENTIEIYGKYPLGSLVISTDLVPLGVIVKSDYLSEVLLVKPIYNEMFRLIKRTPGWIGIQGQTITYELSKAFGINEGVVVTNIYEGGPADKAGILRGDVIVEVDKQKIRELRDLQNILSSKLSGDILTVTYLRNGVKKDSSIVLEEPPKEIIQVRSYSTDIKGVLVEEIPDSLKANIRKSVKGVFIRKVSEDSPALGILKEGDIVVEINKKSINDLNDYYTALKEAELKDLLILIYRKDSFQYVIIPAQSR